MRSWLGEGAASFTTAAAALARAAENAQLASIYGMLLARHGWFPVHLGRQAEGKQLLERSLAILRPLGPSPDLVFALNYLGVICAYLGEYGPGRTRAGEGRAMAEAIGDRYGQAVACNILGQI